MNGNSVSFPPGDKEPPRTATSAAAALDIATLGGLPRLLRDLGFQLRWELVATPPGLDDVVDPLAPPRKAKALVMSSDWQTTKQAIWLAFREGLAATFPEPESDLVEFMRPLAEIRIIGAEADMASSTFVRAAKAASVRVRVQSHLPTIAGRLAARFRRA